MNSKALPGRINIIVTRQPNFKAENIVVANTINDAMLVAEETDCKEICVIGGGEIFKEMLPNASRIYITRVHTHLEGDVYFPQIEESKWKLVSSRKCFKDEKHAYDYTFETWEKL